MLDINLNAIIGSNIRRLRKEKNFSQSDLAEFTGITQSGISKIEDGVRELTMLDGVKIANILNVDLTAFITFIQDDEPPETA